MLTFSSINRNIRSIRRYRNILGILIKYGFGHVVEQLNINYYLELGRRLVTFGGAMFAAFPEVYATVFSGFYTPFMALLFALIFRAVSMTPSEWL